MNIKNTMCAIKCINSIPVLLTELFCPVHVKNLWKI